MANSKPTEPKAEGGIEIDYDHLDVADLMARIQGKLVATTAAAEDTADKGALRATTRPPVPRGTESATAKPPTASSGASFADAAADAESGFETDSEEFEEPLPEAFLEPPLAAEPTPSFEPRGLKQKIKKLFLILMRPFFPIIRLLGLPLHQDIRATQKSLYATDLRLDQLVQLVHHQEIVRDLKLDRLERLADRRIQRIEAWANRRFQQIERRYDQRVQDVEIAVERRFQSLETALDERFQTLELRLDERMDAAAGRQDKSELRLDLLEARLDARIKDVDKSMEYIRLLHNLEHNLVVELTKLKIETDTLKSKFRILEKDQEYLKSRERALEEKALG